jgi:S-(hydroxymethyl)glutathione dehydrogenase/alcohol dehydrogenase
VGVEAAGAFSDLFPLVRKYGDIALMAWLEPDDTFSLGRAFSFQHLNIRCGIFPSPRKFTHEVMRLLTHGQLDPSIVISHTMPLADAASAYSMLSERTDGAVKVVLRP